MAETREIPGWPGYFVTNEGRVFSQWRRQGVRGVKGFVKGAAACIDPAIPMKELRQFDRDGKGYRAVHLRGDGRSQAARVHRLVLLSFVGPCPDGCEARHLNGIKSDNRLSNLAWGTHEENEDDRARHGHVLRGEQHGQSRFTVEQIRDIRHRLSIGEGPTAIGRLYGVSKTAICFIRDGKSWRHVI